MDPFEAKRFLVVQPLFSPIMRNAQRLTGPGHHFPNHCFNGANGMSKHDLTAERLRELFSYDPETGFFTLLKRRMGSRQKVGHIQDQLHKGYVCATIDGHQYRCHRLAWLYIHGVWPNQSIDHINGIKTDNRILNLRDVSHSVNMQNIKTVNATSTTGVLGAQKDYKGRFKSLIQVDGKKRYLGYFKTAEEANQAYLKAKREHHPGCTI